MNRVLFILSASIALLTACDQEPAAPGKSAEPGATKDVAASPAPAAEAGPFDSWDLAARKAAFQGAHVTPGDSIGQWAAWNVEGDKVTIWNGAVEKTFELALTSPCTVDVTERSEGGSSATTYHYTVKNGALLLGLDGGSRRGNEAVACLSNKVLTLDAAGVCAEWSSGAFDDWKSGPGTCAFVKDGDKEQFVATVNGSEVKLLVDGDAIHEDLADPHSEKMTDFAAAKAARDAKK